MSIKFISVEDENRKMEESLSQKELIENFEEIKKLFYSEDFVRTNDFLKNLSFFVEKNIPLDVDVSWIECFICFCNCNDCKNKQICDNFLFDIIKSSMIDALSEDKSANPETKQTILNNLSHYGLEAYFPEEYNQDEDFDEEVSHNQESNNVEELYF